MLVLPSPSPCVKTLRPTTPPPDRFGRVLDNAAAELFNPTLKVEYVHRHRFTTRAEARLKIATWIADFYNTRRRHSATDRLPPIVCEQQIMTARTATKVKSQKTIAA
ncbi:integrase core domain-containing protein [Streptosporangium sp. NPDC023825]|uniref:integrase core domain-containing protein n=1 Tax=Streptosporangium sp. NPDC023825 TaxID=3154909 RepID=UPI00341312E9